MGTVYGFDPGRPGGDLSAWCISVFGETRVFYDEKQARRELMRITAAEMIVAQALKRIGTQK